MSNYYDNIMLPRKLTTEARRTRRLNNLFAISVRSSSPWFMKVTL